MDGAKTIPDGKEAADPERGNGCESAWPPSRYAQDTGAGVSLFSSSTEVFQSAGYRLLLPDESL